MKRTLTPCPPVSSFGFAPVQIWQSFKYLMFKCFRCLLSFYYLIEFIVEILSAAFHAHCPVCFSLAVGKQRVRALFYQIICLAKLVNSNCQSTSPYFAVFLNPGVDQALPPERRAPVTPSSASRYHRRRSSGSRDERYRSGKLNVLQLLHIARCNVGGGEMHEWTRLQKLCECTAVYSGVCDWLWYADDLLPQP